jgi:membrane-associated phospholipid phosphatase
MISRTLVLLVVVAWAGTAAAQTDVAISSTDGTINAPSSPTATAAPALAQPKASSAVNQGNTKPTRGFFPALGHNLIDDVKHIPRRNSVYWLGGGIGLAYAVHPIDHTFNAHLEGHTNYFIAGQYIGEWYTILGAGAAAYAFGRAKDFPRTEHLGLDEIEGVILSEGTVEAAKSIIRRPRPTTPGGTLTSGYSMPSGHATLTFTAATILQQHLGYKAAIPTYLIASYVAMSRLHDNVHYASDVVMGAATGIIIGRSVTWHGRNFYGELQPVRGGAAVTFATR